MYSPEVEMLSLHSVQLWSSSTDYEVKVSLPTSGSMRTSRDEAKMFRWYEHESDEVPLQISQDPCRALCQKRGSRDRRCSRVQFRGTELAKKLNGKEQTPNGLRNLIYKERVTPAKSSMYNDAKSDGVSLETRYTSST